MAQVALLASENDGKLGELRVALPDWELEPLRGLAYPPETGANYYENARAKALFGSSAADARGAWVLGEDSGIEVDGLGGAPGLLSARFGGDDPVGRLLEELRGLEGPNRIARYVSELVAVLPDGTELRGTGVLRGRIGHEPRGSEGFGYDPIFIPDGEERTVAQLGNSWKRTNSHRARAAAALLELVAAG